MGRKKTRLLDPRVEPLRKQIERWRQTRPKRSAMPEVIWQAAAKLAREHGVYAAAQALGLSYGSLRTRAEAATAATRTRQVCKESRPQVTFVELPAAMRAAAPGTGVVVEVMGPSGQLLTVRLQPGELDLAQLIRACWSGRT